MQNLQFFFLYLMIIRDVKSSHDYVSCVICFDSSELSLEANVRRILLKAYNDDCHPKQFGFFNACYVMFEMNYFVETFRFSFFGWNSSTIMKDNLTIITTIDDVQNYLRIQTKFIYTCLSPFLCNDLLFNHLIESKQFNGIFSKNSYDFQLWDRFHILLQEDQYDIYLLCFVDGFEDSQPCEEDFCSLEQFHDSNRQTCGGGNDAQITVETLITPSNERFEWISYICNSDECNNLEIISRIKNIFKSNSHASNFFWPTDFTLTRPTTTIGNHSSM